MILSESDTLTGPTSYSGFRPSKLLGKALFGTFLCLFAIPALAVHPYEKWADELGIDLDISYDATRVMELEGNRFEVKEYKAPGKMYTEVQMGNMTSGIILREDLNKGYLLMPSMGFYKESSLEDGLMQARNEMDFSKIEKVGSETVIGFPSTKYKTQFKDKEGKGSGFMWVTDSGVPIKMDMVYSSRGEKGQRINMHMSELNLREQDPEVFEVPPNLQPMNMGNLAGGLGGLMQQGQPAQPAAEPANPVAQEDVSAEQQACLERAVKEAEEQQAKEKKKRAFGRLMGAVSRVASRFGSSELAQVSADVYSANATADDISSAAKDLGITEEAVERCRQP